MNNIEPVTATDLADLPAFARKIIRPMAVDGSPQFVSLQKIPAWCQCGSCRSYRKRIEVSKQESANV